MDSDLPSGQPNGSPSSISWVDQLSLEDKDAIEELTLVLSANLADLADLGAAERDRRLVGALEHNLVLASFALAEHDLHAGEHLDELVLLASQEVLDSDLGAVLGDDNVDGEVSMHEFHSVAVALTSKYNY